MTAHAAPSPVARPRGATRAVSAAALRLASFAALAAFAAAHWAALVAPTAVGKMWLLVALACVCAPALRWIDSWPRPRRAAGLGLLAVGQLLALLLVVGVQARLLRPDAWGDLAAGIGQGISALPGVNVPYRGLDEWVRTVLLAGGGLLLLLAAALAFRARARAGANPPIGAAAVLAVVYAVPVVEHGPRLPFLSGAAFALLLAAFLWGERLQREDVGVALILAVAAVTFGAVIAPRVDGAKPLLDYEQIAADLEGRGATTFNWSHRYGPLDWPRDGREVLRVKAKTPAYWKAINLNLFDGVRWRQSGTVNPNAIDSEFAAGHDDWHQTITVVVRNLRSFQYVGAGTTEGIRQPPRAVVTSDPGTFVTGIRPLRRGDTYKARVYTPRPTAGQLRLAGTSYPDFGSEALAMSLPSIAGGPPEGEGITPDRRPGIPTDIVFPRFHSKELALAVYPFGYVDNSGTGLVRASRYARDYALAQRLAAASATPYEFVRRVQRRVQQGATYSESPPARRLPLDAFLFSDRFGYCQQFSGAMTLLLRMGGVPARVASGFTPGTLDRRRGEYVVRDLDAHSWVEAYFPGYGWVPFDPTPTVAPPRAQAGGRFETAAVGDQSDKGGAGDRGGDPRAAGAGASDDGSSWGLPVALAALFALGLLAFVRLERSGRLPTPAPAPELAELLRAMHRSGRPLEPSTTLARLEVLLDTHEGGAEYVRALKTQRYGGHAAAPTTAQRRELRRALGAGLGLRGRVRAWWALPPRLRPLRRA